MNDAAIYALAHRAGIAVEWKDYANKPHRVTVEVLRRVLDALGLPCSTTAELAESERAADAQDSPALVSAPVGQPIRVALSNGRAGRARVLTEDGRELPARIEARGIFIPGIDTPGYHVLETDDARLTIAVAPVRCVGVGDLAAGRRLWGPAAQTYGLRSAGDCGIGDMAGVAACARNAAMHGADALGLSPVHAGFAADPNAYSPYSPSSRLFYNPLHADAQAMFGDRVAAAAATAGLETAACELEQNRLIDWPRSAQIKLAILRALFADFRLTDLATGGKLAEDFAAFRTAGGALLENHARFEALHGERLKADPHAWNWAQWPLALRDPAGREVAQFAAEHADDVTFHVFLQWLAERSLRRAQDEARQAGMRIGLIADLAVGMSAAGSHAWTSQKDILVGLEIGAPPDLYNAKGQNWGLTTFSPRALGAAGFSPFIGTLRACLRHAGGVRIDHVMGLLRLWVIPRGAAANEGAYLSYPIDDLLRLTALESHRHRAIVIGEDLGTVPAGFRDRLAEAGIYGMRVLWFERERNRFAPPQAWTAGSVAMTSTHDLPTVAGWWAGADIATRVALGLVSEAGKERELRDSDRRSLWRAFRRARAAAGEPPPPAETAPVADAAVKFVAATHSDMAIVPFEDVLALTEQPNVPGTVTEQPNWRRRYPMPAGQMLEDKAVAARIVPLRERGRP